MRALGQSRGFTLLELVVVVAIIALSMAMAVVSLRSSAQDQLEKEASRLTALLESARMESRTTGVPITWTPMGPGEFAFRGWPERASRSSAAPQRWLHPQTDADIMASSGAAGDKVLGPRAVTVAGSGSAAIALGPEPMISRQRIRLRLGEQTLIVGTDGLGPFRIEEGTSP